MNVNEHTSGDIDTYGGGERPPCIGLTPDALPEVPKPVLAENSQIGVSTRNALSETDDKPSKEAKLALAIPRCEGGKANGSTPSKTIWRKPNDVPHWYALRVTYGREKKAYDYLVEKHVEAYCPTITTIKIIDGKRKSVEESRLPNIFFARGTEEEIKSFVYDNANLPYLRFYYRHFHKGARVVKEPLIVPDYQIENLKIICTSEAEDVLIVPPENRKFRSGQRVRVIGGAFKGVIGRVARYHGQQRVAVIIEGLLTIASAYIPSAFIEVL
ncbi:MAG: UpxY family transcription antiterminator [Prevotellaceae bacterium]|nr:UpxY family transcription antiterminator [Prevotellaceae bacterium]